MAGGKHKAEHKIVREGGGEHLQRDKVGGIQECSFEEFKTVACGHYERYGEKTKGFIFILN